MFQPRSQYTLWDRCSGLCSMLPFYCVIIIAGSLGNFSTFHAIEPIKSSIFLRGQFYFSDKWNLKQNLVTHHEQSTWACYPQAPHSPWASSFQCAGHSPWVLTPTASRTISMDFFLLLLADVYFSPLENGEFVLSLNILETAMLNPTKFKQKQNMATVLWKGNVLL